MTAFREFSVRTLHIIQTSYSTRYPSSSMHFSPPPIQYGLNTSKCNLHTCDKIMLAYPCMFDPMWKKITLIDHNPRTYNILHTLFLESMKNCSVKA